MNGIKIAEYNERDRETCIELLKQTFPGTSDAETFRWRFETKSRHRPLIICAKDREKVVSFNSWIPWEFTYGDHSFLGYQSGESATYKEYRRMGIFGKVLVCADETAAERKIDFLFGFPTSMSYNAFYKSGYYPIGIFNYYIRIINPLAKKTIKKTSYSFDELLPQSLFEKDKLTPVFDPLYYEWRYLKNPKNYEIVKYNENNCQAIFITRKGYYYNRKYRVKIPELTLLDYHFNSYNIVFIENAYKHLDKIYAGKVLFIKTFINEKTDRGRVSKRHFKFRMNSWFETLIVKQVNMNIDHNLLYNCNNWDILPHVKDGA